MNSRVQHLTCRNGMRMNPEWSNSPIEATCNEHLEWELNPDVAYSCVQGTLYILHQFQFILPFKKRTIWDYVITICPGPLGSHSIQYLLSSHLSPFVGKIIIFTVNVSLLHMHFFFSQQTSAHNRQMVPLGTCSPPPRSFTPGSTLPESASALDWHRIRSDVGFIANC